MKNTIKIIFDDSPFDCRTIVFQYNHEIIRMTQPSQERKKFVIIEMLGSPFFTSSNVDDIAQFLKERKCPEPLILEVSKTYLNLTR